MTMRTLSLAIVAAITMFATAHADPQRGRRSTHPKDARKSKPVFVHREDEQQPGRGRKKNRRPDEPSVIEVFKDFDAWFGENRDAATLTSLGKVPGIDYFVHPLRELADGISPNADVVLLTSNGWGQASTRDDQNAPAAQTNLGAFVQSGGVLIVDMGDNDAAGGFEAPGAIGTPDLVFPFPEADASLTPAAAGPDGVLGTNDDHRLVRGPDGVAGTADDLTNSNIDACCYVAHGNLEDGIALPPAAKVLMTAQFGGVPKPIAAEYCLGSGRVIVDTVTKEFAAHQPEGTGPSYFLTALLAYALDPSEHVPCQIEGLIGSLNWMAAGRPFVSGLEAKLRGAAAAIEMNRANAACGKLGAFTNALRAHARALSPAIVTDWTRRAERIRSALACR
jgi:hypothetical protein